MEGGQGWRFIGGGDGSHDKSTVINSIMLRYRPIAPKPATGCPDLYGGSASGNASLLISRRRTKRKYVRIRKKNNNSYNKNIGCNKLGNERSNDNVRDGLSVTTLQLLPAEKWNGRPEDYYSTYHPGSTRQGFQYMGLNLMRSNSVEVSHESRDGLSDRTIVIGETIRARVVEARVTVECVTDTCIDARGLVCTEEEMKANLREDTCPGFISNGLNKVEWVNGAFKRMVSREGEAASDTEVRVWLVMKEEPPYVAFTCLAKLQCEEMIKYSQTQTVPCDAWRMDSGGFAWRLDVKAALSLGR